MWAKFDNGKVDVRINELQISWNGEVLTYSADGGLTWTDTQLERVHVAQGILVIFLD